ncbi:MAG: DNA repair protein RecN [Nitrospirae bacterium]|nr:DNA repair protein RecN [Nitrospirota bacterium]
MLKELRVKNFAIIDKLKVGFQPGLNVLTGETGAGKSIIIGALSIALGERAYSEMIKTNADSASVEAYFDITGHPLLKDMGIPSDDGIILRRDIASSGKGRAYINDTMVNVQSLLEIGKTLVDIHGQHEHESLLSNETQMSLLDYYGKLGLQRENLSSRFKDVTASKKTLEELMSNIRDRAQRIDLIRFQINEIEGISPNHGEDRILEEERTILLNLSKLKELSESAYMALYSEEDSSIEMLSSSISKLKEMSAIDSQVSEPLNILESALPLIKEAVTALRDIKEKYNLDPERLTHVDERLHLIKSLLRKYGDTIEAVSEHKERIKKELEHIEVSDEKIKEMENELKEKSALLLTAANTLSEMRKKTAKRLSEQIKASLKELALEKADFMVDIKTTAISASGLDLVEFLFSANPGEAIKPLGKVASGGELSRIMLSIKSVLRDVDNIPVLIFDEVDAGIGGKTGDNVAHKLKHISNGRQVICITHLPQIAGVADNHLLIEKRGLKEGVNVIIKELSGDERLKEIARMLSGKITETSLKHAGEILKMGF